MRIWWIEIMAEFDELPDVSETKLAEKSDSWLLSLMGWFLMAIGWSLFLFCGLMLLTGIIVIFSDETKYGSTFLLCALSAFMLFIGWIIQRAGQDMVWPESQKEATQAITAPQLALATKTTAKDEEKPIVLNVTPAVFRQPETGFTALAVWTLLSVVLFVVLLGFIGWAITMVVKQSDAGRMIVWGMLSLMFSGCLSACFWAACKKCGQIYRAYDAAQRRW